MSQKPVKNYRELWRDYMTAAEKGDNRAALSALKSIYLRRLPLSIAVTLALWAPVIWLALQ